MRSTITCRKHVVQSGYAVQGWVSRRKEFCSSVILYSHLFFGSVPHYSLPLLTSPLSGGREVFMRCREMFAPLWEFLSSPTSCHRLRFPITFFHQGLDGRNALDWAQLVSEGAVLYQFGYFAYSLSYLPRYSWKAGTEHRCISNSKAHLCSIYVSFNNIFESC